MTWQIDLAVCAPMALKIVVKYTLSLWLPAGLGIPQLLGCNKVALYFMIYLCCVCCVKAKADMG
jgi:hypothetical protein